MKNVFNILLPVVISILFSTNTFAQYPLEITVAQDGSGDYKTIQEAVCATKAFPDQQITIFIKNGIYKEKVCIFSWNTHLMLKGESVEGTVVTYDDYFSRINLGRNSTFHTYTMKVEANDFIAENLTIENTAGPVGQAIALFAEGDRCQFRNCRILGFQDTLYTAGEGCRQYFTDCFIAGTTDFIFGDSTALFESCTIHSKANSFITAASTPKDQSYGYVFRNCKLTADDSISEVYLGRPWRDYARVVYINCEIGPHILPEGWSNWEGTDRDKTAFFAEYGNYGQGAETANRVPWSKKLSEKEVKKYTVRNVFGAATSDMWMPAKK